MKSCKCTVELGQYDDRATIVFCPLHAAAAEMLDSLSDLLSWRSDECPITIADRAARLIARASQPAKD